MEYDVEIVEVSGQHAAVVSDTVAHDGVAAFIGPAFGTVMSVLSNQGVSIVGPPFGRFDLRGHDFFVEAGFPTSGAVTAADGVTNIELPSGEAASTMHVGGYDGVGQAYSALEVWMSKHGYVPSSGPWESYLDGPNVDEPRTVITWPCQRVGA